MDRTDIASMRADGAQLPFEVVVNGRIVDADSCGADRVRAFIAYDRREFKMLRLIATVLNRLSVETRGETRRPANPPTTGELNSILRYRSSMHTEGVKLAGWFMTSRGLARMEKLAPKTVAFARRMTNQPVVETDGPFAWTLFNARIHPDLFATTNDTLKQARDREAERTRCPQLFGFLERAVDFGLTPRLWGQNWRGPV